MSFFMMSEIKNTIFIFIRSIKYFVIAVRNTFDIHHGVIYDYYFRLFAINITFFFPCYIIS